MMKAARISTNGLSKELKVHHKHHRHSQCFCHLLLCILPPKVFTVKKPPYFSHNLAVDILKGCNVKSFKKSPGVGGKREVMFEAGCHMIILLNGGITVQGRPIIWWMTKHVKPLWVLPSVCRCVSGLGLPNPSQES